MLKETDEEKDLGVIVSNDLKWNKQCFAAASKANRVLGQIRSSFSCMDQDILKPLYVALVRPHLEYAVSSWNPATKTNINILERVQRRATKMVKKLKSKQYEERLQAIGLTNLEDRRVRGDLIQMYKIVYGIEKINLVNGVNYAKSLELNLRRQHSMKLSRELNKNGSHRYNFLTNRVVTAWNGLSDNAIMAKSVNAFKSRIDSEVFGRNNGNDCNGPYRAKRY